MSELGNANSVKLKVTTRLPRKTGLYFGGFGCIHYTCMSSLWNCATIVSRRVSATHEICDTRRKTIGQSFSHELHFFHWRHHHHNGLLASPVSFCMWRHDQPPAACVTCLQLMLHALINKFRRKTSPSWIMMNYPRLILRWRQLESSTQQAAVVW